MRIHVLGLAIWLGIGTQSALAQSLNTSETEVEVVREVGPEIGSEAGFRAWVKVFRAQALQEGIDGALFDRVMDGAHFEPKIIERDRNQNEFTKTIWVYLDTAVSEERVRLGRLAIEKHRPLLEKIEAAYGVEKEVVAAIWGLETAYGTFRGKDSTIGALATLSYDGRRARFFQTQLLAALKILQSGDVEPAFMLGSWAGAMGHTQFMPTSWWDFAVDFDGDGKKNIWGDDPADGLASAANYLRHWGWKTGQAWGYEVQIPQGFDYDQTTEQVRKTVDEWALLGLRKADGSELTGDGIASVLLPGGHRGAAFLIFPNFQVIERYNTADAYVVAIGHLSDRLRGEGPLRSDWPRELRALTLDERMELQRRLTEAGFDAKGVDGRIGPNTVAAVKSWQRANGRVPDGFASTEVLDGLR